MKNIQELKYYLPTILRDILDKHNELFGLLEYFVDKITFNCLRCMTCANKNIE